MSLLDDAKTMLGITDNTFDAILGIIVPAIKAEADGYMGLIHTARVEDREQVFDGGDKTYYLAHANVSGVHVYIDEEEISDEDYLVSNERGIVRLDGFSAPTGKGNVLIRYSGGYEESNLPASLRRKLMKQIEYEFRRRNDPGLSSVSYPGGMVSKFFTDEWLPDVEEELKRRRRVRL